MYSTGQLKVKRYNEALPRYNKKNLRVKRLANACLTHRPAGITSGFLVTLSRQAQSSRNLQLAFMC